MASVPDPSVTSAEVAPGIFLDSRRALVHSTQRWMALADLHYGYELHRNRQGALLPNWGMAQCQATILALLQDYHPQRLILVGDIMDGAGSAAQTSAFLDHLLPQVSELVLIEGNHDRSALKKGWPLKKSHREGNFIFHHGHQGIAPPSVFGEIPSDDPTVILITGHEHPSVSLRDSAGLRLKLPTLIQQRLPSAQQHWILPAFSPWASGGEYSSAYQHLATWACTPTRVWQLF